ncbi:MAG: hypothetical protein ISS23_04040, partial [Nanoarchaeota archaeon]|nr:hypothetical protein [Nanoarchaeota archaeon]
MSVLKKTNQAFKRSVHWLIFINLVCSATTFSLLYFAGRKIQDYILMIYAYAPSLQDMQNVLSESISSTDLDKLNEALAVINQAYTYILWITVASLIIFFLLVCFFQSLEWRISYRSLKKAVKLEKIFEKHWGYALKFSLITLPAFIIILPSVYYLIANIKSLFLNLLISLYGITEQVPTINYVSLTLLTLLILATTYFTALSYILLNKYKIREAVKKAFKIGIKKAHILL